MGIRSGGLPDADQAFVRRMLHALDMTPQQLAREVAGKDEVLYAYTWATLETWLDRPLYILPDLDRDDVWLLIEQYVNRQFAYLMATRDELMYLSRQQRAKRQARRVQQRALPSTPAPTSMPRRPR